jgi:hypothetical protein
MLGKCPVCRSAGWRGVGVPTERGGVMLPHSEEPRTINMRASRMLIGDEITDFDEDDDGDYGYGDNSDRDEGSLCMHLGYWALCGTRCDVGRLLDLFLVTWLRGLGIGAIATGSLAAVTGLGTLWLVAAGEAANCAVAIVVLLS